MLHSLLVDHLPLTALLNVGLVIVLHLLGDLLVAHVIKTIGRSSHSLLMQALGPFLVFLNPPFLEKCKVVLPLLLILLSRPLGPRESSTA